MKNTNKPQINQRKFFVGNDIVITAIKESWYKEENQRCDIEFIMGINGITVLECHVLRTSDITFYPSKMIMYYNPVMLYSGNDLLQIIKLMNNGVLNRMQVNGLCEIVLLHSIEVCN